MRERRGGGGSNSKVESQALARSGKFGSSDDAGSTSNSSGHFLSLPAGRRDMGESMLSDEPYCGRENKVASS